MWWRQMIDRLFSKNGHQAEIAHQRDIEDTRRRQAENDARIAALRADARSAGIRVPG